MTTPLDLDAIEALANAATDGPWTAHPDGLVWTTRPTIGDPVSGSVLPEDAQFIAACRTAVPQLVAEVRQHRAAQQPTTPVVEPTDRQLLAAVHRWARTHGWAVTWIGWANADWANAATAVVEWDHEELTVRRRPPAEVGQPWPSGLGSVGRREQYPVVSVRQAVDVLVALEVLPAELSSAHRAAVAGR